MMAKLMELLERFVVAVETIAGSGCCTSGGNVPVRIQGETVSMPMGPGVVISEKEALQAGCATSPSNQAVTDAAKLKREMIKKELREKGIAFNASAKTETLEKLLASVPAGQKPEAPKRGEQKEQEVSTNAQQPPTPPTSYTREQIRDALVKVSAAKGKDEALGIMKTLGKAEKLSDVDPSKFMLIMDACRVRGVAC